MPDAPLAELIALLARYEADGDLASQKVAEAIQALFAAEAVSDPGLATLLELLLQHRQSVPDPAIDSLVNHIRHVRQSAAERFHQARQQGPVDLADFERTLGDLPLEEAQRPSTANPWHITLRSAISLARDRRFLASRRDLSPSAAQELDRQFEAVAPKCCSILEHANRRLVHELINAVRPVASGSLDDHWDQLLAILNSPQAVVPAWKPDDDLESLESLAVGFHSATTSQQRQQCLDRICVWSGGESYELILDLVEAHPEFRDRVSLILTCRNGPRQARGWTGWENALGRANTRRLTDLVQVIRHSPIELLLLWASRQEGVSPELLRSLNELCDEHAVAVNDEEFIKRWGHLLTGAEINALLGTEFEDVVAAPENVWIDPEPGPESAAQRDPIPVSQQPAVATSPGAARAESPVAASRPRPPHPASIVWRDHIQPWLSDNWFLVVGIVMGVAGASLLSVWLWDSVPLVRFTVLPTILAVFTLAVASVGSWIERQNQKFRGTGIAMRGTAIALLPLNFMVVSLLAAEETLEHKVVAVIAMGLTYVCLFGWALRRWCGAVHKPLAVPLAAALLATNGLVMVGPIAAVLSQNDWAGLPMLIAIGFHAGFGLVAWTVVRFATRMLTLELASEKSVPWFVGATLAASYLQVFGWVHFQLGALPEIWTYALLVILAGWLVLFTERRALELADESRSSEDQSGGRLGHESFLGYAMVMLGVLMGSTHQYVRIVSLGLAGIVWLYQASKRKHELQHWIGLTMLSLAGASVALLPSFPRDPWLPSLGLAMAFMMGLVHRLARHRDRPLLANAARGLQPTLAMLTAVSAVLAQWHFRSAPIGTAGFLAAAGLVFAWRAWRDQELRWVHSAMAIVGISLPYIGCVDMVERQLRGNTMAFGLAAASLAWLLLIWGTRSRLLLKARSTVLMVYGSLAVAAMVLRVLFEDGTATDLDPWHQGMEYAGPLLMAGILAIATYHTRSLLPAVMATVIAVILFPELKARFSETFDSLGWGTGLGSAWSGLGLVLLCFPLSRASWLNDLGEGDKFFDRIPFPFRRYDHTLFTWPMAASAVFLSFRVDSWTVLQNAIPGSFPAQLVELDLSLIPFQTAIAVTLTGATWTLLGVFLRARRGASMLAHLGWISVLAGLLLGNHLLESPWHLSWPILLTGLILHGLELLYSMLQSRLPGIESSLAVPTRAVLAIGSPLLAVALVGTLLLIGVAEFQESAFLVLFVAVQLARLGISTGRLVFGSCLFGLAWAALLASSAADSGALLAQLSVTTSLTPTLWLVLGIHAVHLGLEAARPVHHRLRALLRPSLVISTVVTVIIGMISCLDAITSGGLTVQQQWLALAAVLLAARNHGSAWVSLLGLAQSYILMHVMTGLIEPGQPVANVDNLLAPWRIASLALTASCLGYSGSQLAHRRPALLNGPFAEPIFGAQAVLWLFVPAVMLSVVATGVHAVAPAYRASEIQLVTPFLSAVAILIVTWSLGSRELAWMAVATLSLGNIHAVRLLAGDELRDVGLSEIHLVALGLVASLSELTVIRMLWRRKRVATFVNTASLAGAALVLLLICFNYVTDPGLADIPWGRFVVSGAMAYVAGLYFRSAARRPTTEDAPRSVWRESGYHFGVTLAIWCAALLIPALREPMTALFALAIPVGYFHIRTELGFASGSNLAPSYRNSTAALSLAIVGLWLFRVAFHLLMFPEQPFDVISYHANAPLVMLLSIVMLRLHGLGGANWLALYGGLSLLAGSFFSLTWITPLRPLDHPMAAAWSAIGLAHFWTLVSQQRSPLRTAVQRMGRIDGPTWFQLRRIWGVSLLIAVHASAVWGLFEAVGISGFVANPASERLAAPLLLGAASVLVHMGIIRGSAMYLRVAVVEVLLALHAGFVVESFLAREHIVWALLGGWTAALVTLELASHRITNAKPGTGAAILGGLTLAHILFEHHPDSTTGLWAFAILALLAALTPRTSHNPKSGEEAVAASLLFVVPTWLAFFSQANLSEVVRTADWTWPLLVTTSSLFVTGSLSRWFQARLLTSYDTWRQTRPRLVDQALSLAGRYGEVINIWTLRLGFASAVVIQLAHYNQVLAARDIALLCLLYAAYSAGWYFEGQRQRTMSTYVLLQLCVLGFFSVLRRQLINSMPELWSPEYDVWASLVVSFGLCGAKQVIDTRPREIRIPLLGTLISLPVVALVWVIYNQMGSDVAMLVVGLHSLMFTFLGKDDRESPYNIVAVGGFVAFVLLFFWTRLELRMVHAFVIPVGLGILVLLQLFRGRMEAETRNRIRLVTLLTMLGSAGYYALLDSSHPVAFHLTLIVLSLAAMGLGSFLRIRLYLVLGFTAVLVDVASIVFRILRDANQTAQRASIGALLLVIGIGLVGGTIFYKTRREQVDGVINGWRQRLGDWE